MSYDVSLVDPVTFKVLEVPEHLMGGGTVKAQQNPVTGKLEQAPCSEAWINITYNYSQWYHNAFNEILGVKDSGGIKHLSGISGIDSIPLLNKVIALISKTDWHTELDVTEESLEKEYQERLANLKALQKGQQVFGGMIHCDMPEKRNINSYWVPTRVNALRPLYMLVALAKMRPDGVWSVS